MLGTSSLATAGLYLATSDLGTGYQYERTLMLFPIFVSITMIGFAIAAAGERTLIMLVGIYNVLFLLIPALLQLAIGTFPFFGAGYSPETVGAATGMIAVFTVAFFALYCFRGLGPTLPVVEMPQGSQTMMSPRATSLICLSLLAIAFFVFLSLGPELFLQRRGEAFSTLDFNPIFVVYQNLGRFAAFFAFTLSSLLLLEARQSKGLCWALWIFSLAVLLLVDNPLNLPRYVLFGFLIALICVFFDTQRTAFKCALLFMFLIGVTTIFPLISNVSRGSPGSALLQNSLQYYSTSGDFDGFQSIMNIYLMVQTEGLSLGTHLLSDLFFFVPRSIWPGKALGTGGEAAMFMGYPFINISGPLPAELFADFGWAGVAVGGGLTGYACAAMDAGRRLDTAGGSRLGRLVYAMMAGFVMIVMRGSLLGIIGPVLLGIAMASLLRRACRPMHSRKQRSLSGLRPRRRIGSQADVSIQGSSSPRLRPF